MLEQLATSSGFVRAGAVPAILSGGEVESVARRDASARDGEFLGVPPQKGSCGPDSVELRSLVEGNFRVRVDRGDFGVMTWMSGYTGKRVHPDLVADWCRTVLVFALPVCREDAADQDPSLPGGLVARYARGRDYHKVLGRKLEVLCRELSVRYPGGQWRPWVDAHPLDEVWFAQAGGLGFRGRHSLLIAGPWASWVALGLVLTSFEIKPGLFLASHGKGAEARSCPPSCRACVHACPTGAVGESGGQWRVDTRKCIAYLNIENRGSIDSRLRRSIGRRLFGCDACQEACPLGKRAPLTLEPDFLDSRAGALLDPGEILDLKDRKAFEDRFAGTPLMRPGLEGLKRTACVVAGNTRRQDLKPRLEALAGGSEGPLIAEHARWALDEFDREEADHG